MTTSILAFFIVLGVLIFFHELGHFLMARLFGVGVEIFSLGFGPRLVGKTIGITDYRISAVPLGGFVKMVGEEPDADLEPSQIPLSFNHKHVLKRILIVAAGPIFNLLLAVIIFFGFFWISGIEDVTPVIREIKANGPAHKAGLKKNDLLISIDGVQVESWYDIGKALEHNQGSALTMRVQRGDFIIEAEVTPELKVGRDIFGDEVSYFSAGISGNPALEAIIGAVSPGSAAAKGGLRKGDKIVAINGREIEDWNVMREIVAASKGQPLDIKLLRAETFLNVEVTPAFQKIKNAVGMTEERYLIGISSAGIIIPEADKVSKRLNLFAAFIESFKRTYFVVEISAKGIVKLITGAISRDNIGGPIAIAQIAGQQVKQGVANLIQFIAFISINLAILNFLPIPVLDGGHLMFFFIEAAIRRPVGIRVREIAQQAGMFVLILLMIFVFYNDLMRVFSG